MLKSDETFKAYVVTEEHEGQSVVVYAKHRATAQSWGASHHNESFADVTCRRAPEFDALYPEGPSNEDLWHAGWWFPCGDCYSGRVEIGGGGHHTPGDGFYCHSCTKDFMTMKPIQTPREVTECCGDRLYSRRNASPYFWYRLLDNPY